jgi:hypothetical protein
MKMKTMKTKHIFFLATIFAASFFFACNKDVFLDNPGPTPDYRDQYEGTYSCRQVDVLKEELTHATIDTTFDGILSVNVTVDHNLPGTIHVNEREIPLDSNGTYSEYKYSLKFSNDSIYINKQIGSNGSYTDTFIWGKMQ